MRIFSVLILFCFAFSGYADEPKALELNPRKAAETKKADGDKTEGPEEAKKLILSLPPNHVLTSSLDFQVLGPSHNKHRERAQAVKTNALTEALHSLGQKIREKLSEGMGRQEEAQVWLDAKMSYLARSIDNTVAGQLAEEEPAVMDQLPSRIQTEVDQWVKDQITDLDKSVSKDGFQLMGANQYEAAELPDYENFEYDVEAGAKDAFGNTWKINIGKKKESESLESSEIRRIESNTSATLETKGGLKIVVFNRKDEFYLRHVLRAHTKVKGHLEVNASAAADVLNEAQNALNTYYPNAPGTIDHATAQANLDGRADLDGTVDTQATVDLNIIQQEKGIRVALPVAKSKTGSKLILESGFIQRVDFVVLSLVSANAVGRGTVSGNATVSGSADIGVSPNLPNGFPFQIPSQNIHLEDSRSFSDSRSGGGSIDIKKEAQKHGMKTSFGSKSSYYVIPVGIGFYSANGSRIRFLVDLKPERISKPLQFNGPKNVQELNKYLGMVGGAELDMEGRANFDSFTLLAGLNTSFKTVEVNLRDATGDDQAVAAPLHAKAEIFLGVATETFLIKPKIQAEYDINKARVGALVEMEKSFSNGLTFGFLVGYEKRAQGFGAPQMKFSDSYTGSTGRSGTHPYGTYQGAANYGVSHETVINEGQKGYEFYDAVPLEVLVSKDLGSGTGYVKGSALFTNNTPDGSFHPERVGGGAGYIGGDKDLQYNVGFDVFRHNPSQFDNAAPGIGGGLSAGLTF